MQVELKLPSAVEADWKLVDGDGKTLATSSDHPEAMLVFEPFFYKGSYSQSIGRTCTIGKKGKEIRNGLRVAAQTGKVTAEISSVLPNKIVPKFDLAVKEGTK